MINDYKEIKECIYKNEHYSVRDNGAIMRHKREGKKVRQLDEIWTFGKLGDKHYLYLAGVAVHRIVATAFYGHHDAGFVVDHIDTNRCNNRAENLRWFTRLENALNNPITRKKIILKCGSIENFLANPSLLSENDISQDLSWMRIVTNVEAQVSKERLLAWAESDNIPVGNSIGEWIFNEKEQQILINIQQDDQQLVQAKSPLTAWQKKWKVPANFVCCPSNISDKPIEDYFNRLIIGEVYNYTLYYGYDTPTIQTIVDKAYIDNDNTIIVISHSTNNVKPFALSKIYFLDGKFIHESIGTFFEENGVRKQFTLIQGLEWMGGDSIDNYM